MLIDGKPTETFRISTKDFFINELGCYQITNTKNRPIIRVGKDVMSFAKFIYKECFGEVPEGMMIQHKCDNPYCINPEHLTLWTKEKSMKDLSAKRLLKKRKTGHLMTDEEINHARMLIEDKKMSMEEAAEFMRFPISSLFIGLKRPDIPISETNKQLAAVMLKTYPKSTVSEALKFPSRFLDNLS